MKTEFKTQAGLLKEVKLLQKMNFEGDLIKVKFLEEVEGEKEDFLSDLEITRKMLENENLGCESLNRISNTLGYYKHFYKDYVQNERF